MASEGVDLCGEAETLAGCLTRASAQDKQQIAKRRETKASKEVPVGGRRTGVWTDSIVLTHHETFTAAQHSSD